jgi:amino acid permease
VETAKKDADYCFTLKKYYGKMGYYTALVFPTILIFGAITVYFVVITQSLYPLLIVVLKDVFKMDVDYIPPT